MCRVRCVAQQDEVAFGPTLISYRQKLGPQRAIGPQSMTIEVLAKQLLTVRNGVRLGRLIEAGGLPCLLVALDDVTLSAAV